MGTGKKSDLTYNEMCDSGDIQTMSHIYTEQEMLSISIPIPYSRKNPWESPTKTPYPIPMEIPVTSFQQNLGRSTRPATVPIHLGTIPHPLEILVQMFVCSRQ